MTQTTPTRDEVVRDESKVTTAMIDAAFKVCPAGAISEIGTGGMQRMIAAALASAPAPASGGVDAVAAEFWTPWRISFVLRDCATYFRTLYARHNIGPAQRGIDPDKLEAASNIAASLSPAATPVSEAEPAGITTHQVWLERVADRALQLGRRPTRAEILMCASDWEALAKPASSPAGNATAGSPADTQE